MIVLKIIGWTLLAGVILRIAGAYAMNAETRKHAARSRHEQESDGPSRQ